MTQRRRKIRRTVPGSNNGPRDYEAGWLQFYEKGADGLYLFNRESGWDTLRRMGHIDSCVQGHSRLREPPLVVRVRDGAGGPLAVVESVAGPAVAREDILGLDLGPAGIDADDAQVVLEIEEGRILAAGDGLPAALVACAGPRAALGVPVGLRHGLGPVLLDLPAIPDAGGLRQEAPQGLLALGRAAQFHQADEDAGGLGRGQVVDEPLAASGAAPAQERAVPVPPRRPGGAQGGTLERGEARAGARAGAGAS